jgi:immunoglobulin I-set domain protein
VNHLARSLACALFASALLQPRLSRAQNPLQYSIGKLAQYSQTGTGQFSANTAAPFEFNAAAPMQGTLTTPSSAVDELTYVTADSAYEVVQTFATQAAMDQAFPSGTYTFTLTGQAPVNLDLTGDLYPPVPQIVDGTWNAGGALLVDPASDYSISFNAFPGYLTAGAAGQAQFVVRPSVGAAVVNSSWVSFNSPAPTGVTIAAGTLSPGSSYTAQLVYGTDTVADDTTVPGALLLSTYLTTTSFAILAQAPAAIAPVATSQPASQTIASGSTVIFSFETTGSPVPQIQWYLNGVPVQSATSPTLIVYGATAADAGSYTCTAANASGSVTSSAAVLDVVTTQDPGRLVNLSARAEVGTGGNIVFGGFAIGPLGTAGSEPVLIRASGPALEAFSVPGTLPDPQLQLFSSAGAVLDTNDGWAGNATIAATAASVGAFPWNVPTSHDSAFDLSLASGAYTAQVSGQSGDTGDALVEVYDATPAGTYVPSMPRLVNLSARVDVGTGANVLLAGFVVGGSTSLTVLIRASGPAIAAAPFNVPGTLPDPQLTLQNQATQAVLATNNGWGGDPNISSVAAYVGAFEWSDPSSHDSAILLTLPPGNYTAEAAGASGDTGVALVEVYEVH